MRDHGGPSPVPRARTRSTAAAGWQLSVHGVLRKAQRARWSTCGHRSHSGGRPRGLEHRGSEHLRRSDPKPDRCSHRDYRRLNTDAGLVPASFQPVAATRASSSPLRCATRTAEPRRGSPAHRTNATSFTYDDAVKAAATGGAQCLGSRSLSELVGLPPRRRPARVCANSRAGPPLPMASSSPTTRSAPSVRLLPQFNLGRTGQPTRSVTG